MRATMAPLMLCQTLNTAPGMAALGGSVGALLGMTVFHHKTKHKKFLIGVPLILLAQLAVAYFIALR